MVELDDMALRFALALVGPGDDPLAVAQRAYALAEAMQAEGARRTDAAEAAAVEAEARSIDALAPFEPLAPGLLDLPAPWDAWADDDLALADAADAHLDDLTYDPRWDEEPRWSEDAPVDGQAAAGGPGLARTRVRPGADAEKTRSA